MSSSAADKLYLAISFTVAFWAKDTDDFFFLAVAEGEEGKGMNRSTKRKGSVVVGLICNFRGCEVEVVDVVAVVTNNLLGRAVSFRLGCNILVVVGRVVFAGCGNFFGGLCLRR